MGSLRDLYKTAHPNSILLRKYPNGLPLAAEHPLAEVLPHWGKDRTDKDAKVNTGYPDDYIAPTDHDAEWDNPSLTDLDAA